MANTATITEADILEKVVAPEEADVSPETARELLRFRFDSKTTANIRRLLQKNNRGTIKSEEQLLLDKFLRVGQLLDLLHAKARVVLRTSGNAS